MSNNQLPGLKRQPTREEIVEGIDFVQSGLLTVDSADIRAWELCTNVPELMNIWAYVCLVFNIVLPGTGTMICSCLGDADINKT